jgi:hypothetical protein
MEGLYPIIRRVRRPLINTGRLVVPVVVPAPRIEQEGTEGTEILPEGQSVPREETVQPRMDTKGHESGKGEQEGTEMLPDGQSTSEVPRTTTSPSPRTIAEHKERHARKAKEA